MGPTGAGKTDIAVDLATTLPVEIVSVDAAWNIGVCRRNVESCEYGNAIRQW